LEGFLQVTALRSQLEARKIKVLGKAIVAEIAFLQAGSTFENQGVAE
jgi:hypothetical protein